MCLNLRVCVCEGVGGGIWDAKMKILIVDALQHGTIVNLLTAKVASIYLW